MIIQPVHLSYTTARSDRASQTNSRADPAWCLWLLPVRHGSPRGPVPDLAGNANGSSDWCGPVGPQTALHSTPHQPAHASRDVCPETAHHLWVALRACTDGPEQDRKSTRLNSSHSQ